MIDLEQWRVGVASCLLKKGITPSFISKYSIKVIEEVGHLIDKDYPSSIGLLSDGEINKLQSFVATDIELKLRM